MIFKSGRYSHRSPLAMGRNHKVTKIRYFGGGIVLIPLFWDVGISYGKKDKYPYTVSDLSHCKKMVVDNN